jgi:hypothetical protein
MKGMEQYQFVQTEPAAIERRIVPRMDFDANSRAALHRVLAPVVPGVHVHIEPTPVLPAEPSGKYRIMQSRVGDARPVA